MLSRRAFVTLSTTLASTPFCRDVLAASAGLADVSGDALARASVAELRVLLDSGALSVTALTRYFLERIDRLDRRGPAVNAVLESNPDALTIAAERDSELKSGRTRGGLHGIPILIKGNIDTADRMGTSAGSLALLASTPLRDAWIVQQLRASGAVLLGKTNLSEWANFRSTQASSGWSARGGLTKNPHVLDRNASGSSSGTAAALASGFAAIGIGTETDGSIISPSAVCGIVGVKPTVGAWSRSGIIPISASQDTAGPMARTVADAAALLGSLAGVDTSDPTTRGRGRAVELDYTRFLDRAGLVGARLGVPRDLSGFHSDVDIAFEQAIATLRAAGAVIVDGLQLRPSPRLDEAELEVMLYEFKAGLSAYLATRGPREPIQSLADLIAFNQRERAREMPWFGQELFERAQKKGPLSEIAYRSARARCVDLARTNGLDPVLRTHQLDALICPSNPPAWLTDLVNGDHISGGNTTFAAVAGYPSITVPMGSIRHLPLGLSFIGPAWSEGRLFRLAYAFEQRSGARRIPQFLPSIGA